MKMGTREPKQGTDGRPKKAIADKIADGNTGHRPLTVIDFGDSAADLEGQAMPKPAEFLSAKQKDDSTLCAADIYETTWQWLSERGCASLVSPQLIEQVSELFEGRMLRHSEWFSKNTLITSSYEFVKKVIDNIQSSVVE